MRVLHVVQRYHPFRGGSELVFGELSARLRAAGHGVTVYTTDAWDLEYFWSPRFRRLTTVSEIVAGVPVVRWPVRHLPAGQLAYPVLRRLMTHLSDLPLPGRSRLLARLGRLSPWVPSLAGQLAHREPSGDFDLIHACNVTFESLLLAARDYARRAQIPLVMTPFIHLGEPQDHRIRKYYSMVHQLELVRAAAAVIAMTTIERDFLIEHGIDPDRISVVEPGVEPATVTGGDGQRLRQRLGLAERPVICSLGANAYDKGTIHLVEAIQRLWSAGRPVELVIAGPRLSHFDQYLHRLPLAVQQRLKVLGPISDDERRDLLAAGDIFALPSRTDSFGIVYLEAWAVGRPVVGACAGGVPAVIRDGIDGRLVPFGDVPALAAALDELLADPARARAMGAAGQATLAQRSWPVFTQTVSAIYARVLAEGRQDDT